MMFFSQVRIRPDISQSTQLKRLIHGSTYGIHQLLWNLFPGQEKRSFLYREEIAREQLGSKNGVKGEPVFYIVSKEEPADDNPLLAIKSKKYSPIIRTDDLLAFKLRANPVHIEKKERSAQELEGWKGDRAARGDTLKKPTKKRVRHDVVMNSQRKLLIELLSISGLSGTGRKSELKSEVLHVMGSSGNKQVKDRARSVIDENERFRDRLSQKLDLDELLGLALKSDIDKRLENWLVNKGANSGFELLRDNERGRLKFQAESYRWHSLAKKGKTAGFSSVDFDGVLKVTEQNSFMDALFGGIGPAKGFGCGLMMVRRI